MTPSSVDRPQMYVEEFEQLAHHAPETVRLEFIRGKVGVKPVPNGNHGEIIRWLQKQCMQHVPEAWLYPEQGLKVEQYRKGRARPDGALAPEEYFLGQGEWADAKGVLMAVEVTSADSDANARDRLEKPDGYAAVGVPVYLLIDRDDHLVYVFSEPEGGKYRNVVNQPFGGRVDLPVPVGFSLETEKLKDFAD
ncbi:Uma2 family endonuclease [Streptomyces huiliensis]|uniref:Uma2 family endonuclease n=1 Tax=Streptomyces huiliensis TaxID=2876027 RepID=UPI001CBEBA6E|nr:Uma2 family endonuclease [Streptomyces huiliensis]MBZ4320020.1 Uma2 family endonuclease [Streptomyces huiliensis]